MPISILRNIIDNQKGANIRDPHMNCFPSVLNTDSIEGYYVFEKIDFKSPEWMFNDGYPTFVLFPEKENKVCIEIDGKERLLESGWIDKGIQKKIYLRCVEQLEYLLIVRFKPQMLHRLQGLGIDSVKHKSIASLDEIIEEARINTIFSKEKIEDRIEYIDGLIRDFVINTNDFELLEAAIQRIDQLKGCISVANLIQEIGVNYKWLERKFSQYLNLSPKEYIRTIRFLYAYLSLQQDSTDLLSLALNNGFYDYNHFLKEFKGFTGKTPVDYIST